MAYSTNPNLPKAREIALKLLLVEGLSIQLVANKCGVYRTTVWRWKKKWQDLNQNIQTKNYNRPSRTKGLQTYNYRWKIPTLSSKPLGCPHAVPDDLVCLVLETRDKLKRCSEVVYHHLRTSSRLL